MSLCGDVALSDERESEMVPAYVRSVSWPGGGRCWFPRGVYGRGDGAGGKRARRDRPSPGRCAAERGGVWRKEVGRLWCKVACILN
jgi:hypothetical protein